MIRSVKIGMMLGVMGVIGCVGLAFSTEPVAAVGEILAENVETNIIGGGSVDTTNGAGIYTILKLILQILVYGLGVAATLGVVIAGVMYIMAKDSPDKVATAKKRLYEVAIGLVAWAAMWAVLNWLIPGGLNFDETMNGGTSSEEATTNSGETTDSE